MIGTIKLLCKLRPFMTDRSVMFICNVIAIFMFVENILVHNVFCLYIFLMKFYSFILLLCFLNCSIAKDLSFPDVVTAQYKTIAHQVPEVIFIIFILFIVSRISFSFKKLCTLL